MSMWNFVPDFMRRQRTHFVLLLAVGWLAVCYAAATFGQASKAAPNLQNGKHIFETQACQNCHGAQGQGTSPADEEAKPRIGPTRLAQPLFTNFLRRPVGRMPAYPAQILSDADVADLYAYLQSLAAPVSATPSAADAPAGQRLYVKDGCYECHGNLGQGSLQTGASRIGPIAIPFPAFAGYVRHPFGQMPPYTVKALPDGDLAAIYAYLQSLPQAQPSKNIPLLNQ